MTTRRKWRHVAAVAFATTAGFLSGMAAVAGLSMAFQAEPATRVALVSSRGEPRVVPAVDARPANQAAAPARNPASAVAAVPDATLADAPVPLSDPPDLDDAIEDLRKRRLDVPIAIERSALHSSFAETRGGSRQHEAMDLLAPRHTPVVAVEAGIIARLFNSKAGGITVYQFDPTTSYAYYYAHLQRYADGLEEGATVSRGQVLGYVGTSGNAPQNTPHLHFAIFVLDKDKRWWQGTPIDPFDVLRSP